MIDRFTFKPTKKRPGAYFSDGFSTYHIQHDPQNHTDLPNPRLIAAIRAARVEFLRVWNEPEPKPLPGLDDHMDAEPREVRP